MAGVKTFDNNSFVLFDQLKSSKIKNIKQTWNKVKKQSSEGYLDRRRCQALSQNASELETMIKKRSSMATINSLDNSNKKAHFLEAKIESLVKGFNNRKKESEREFDKMINQGFYSSKNDMRCFTLKLSLTPHIAKI